MPNESLPVIAADICDCSTFVADPWRSAGTSDPSASITAFCADGEPARKRPRIDMANTSRGGIDRMAPYVSAPEWVPRSSITIRRARSAPGMPTQRAMRERACPSAVTAVSSVRSCARYRSRSPA
jgi:hypothetical protein